MNGSNSKEVHWTLSGRCSLVRTSNCMKLKMLRNAHSIDTDSAGELFNYNIQHSHLSINQRCECAPRLPITNN